jgi:hypothetical protein
VSNESTQSAEPRPGRPSRDERRLEIAATVLLSIAAVATAWSGYQAALWDGIQSSDYTQASAARTKAAENHLEANQDRMIDLNLVESYLNAQAIGQPQLANHYRSRMRDELKPAFDVWLELQPLTNPNAPRSPQDLPQYHLAAEAQGKELNALADEKFITGEEANATSDTYVATTLFFASVLFFAAISERFDYHPARIVLLSLASSSLVIGLVVAFSQRVTWG